MRSSDEIRQTLVARLHDTQFQKKLVQRSFDGKDEDLREFFHISRHYWKWKPPERHNHKTVEVFAPSLLRPRAIVAADDNPEIESRRNILPQSSGFRFGAVERAHWERELNHWI